MKRESKNFWQDAWARLKRNKLVIGMIGLILIIILALVGPLISKHDFEQNVDYRNLPKNSRIRQSSFLPFDGTGSDGKDAYAKVGAKENYWFGTDQLGRDLWTRTWKGTQISLVIGIVVLIRYFIGVVYGAISGFLVGE